MKSTPAFFHALLRGGAVLGVLLLAGCSSVYETEARGDHKRVGERLDQAQQQLRHNEPHSPHVLVEDVPRFTRLSIPYQPYQVLPAHIGRVTMKTTGQHNLRTVAEWIERLVRIPVRVSPDALLPSSQFMVAAPGATAGAATGAGAQGASASNAQAAAASGGRARQDPSQQAAQGLQKLGAPRQLAAQAEPYPIEVNYEGALHGLLDQVAFRAGVRWSYQNGQIHFFRTIRRVIQVRTMPGNLSQTGSVQLGGGISVSSDLEMNIWGGIEKAVADMVSRQGRFRVDPALGTVTVYDAAANVEAVERYLESLNRQLSRQVSLSVELLQVNLNNQFQTGIDWNYVREVVGAGNLMLSGVPSVPSNTAAVGFVKANAAGTTNQLLIKALESFGRVSSSYSSVITTMNRQPAPLGSTSTQSYLRQVTPSVSSTGTGTVTYSSPGLTPGEIVTGFNINLLPILLDSNMVLVQCSISISALKEIVPFTSGTGLAQQTIQQPNVSNFVTQQRMMVRSGDTIVLSGLENETTESRQTDFKRGVLPGWQSTGRDKSTLVVLITPRLMEY